MSKGHCIAAARRPRSVAAQALKSTSAFPPRGLRQQLLSRCEGEGREAVAIQNYEITASEAASAVEEKEQRQRILLLGTKERLLTL
jgi:hypothetical protein